MCHERKFGFSFTFVSCCPVSVQKDELHLASAWSRARCCPQGPSFFKWFSEQCLENQRSDCTECCDSYSGFLPGPASVSFGCDNVQKDLKPSWGGWGRGWGGEGNLAMTKSSSQQKLPSSETGSSTSTSAGSWGSCDTGSPILCVQGRAI